MNLYRTFFVAAFVAAFLASLAAQTPGDYVPCLFDRERSSRLVIQQALDEWVLLGYMNARQEPALATTLSNYNGSQFAAVLAQMQGAGSLTLPAGITTLELANNLRSAASTMYPKLPADVACSQSLLSWSEAKDSYNRRIADTYFVYQVNVRNLNAQREFLLQDVQVAVQDHEFVAGRDKIIARGVALEGQAYGRRNTVERALEALASLGLAMTGVFPGQSARNGISIFAASLAPGFASIAPDRSDDQMTRFNDTSFSASQAYKIVVPKSGSVTFVTYLPFHIFAPGKSTKNWTQPQWSQFSDSSYVIISGVHITEN